MFNSYVLVVTTTKNNNNLIFKDQPENYPMHKIKIPIYQKKKNQTEASLKKYCTSIKLLQGQPD